MNGRVYDPLLGRMLSPDAFVQNPGGTQAFNRYSYVMNNPLKYSDPTGMLSALDVCEYLWEQTPYGANYSWDKDGLTHTDLGPIIVVGGWGGVGVTGYTARDGGGSGSGGVVTNDIKKNEHPITYAIYDFLGIGDHNGSWYIRTNSTSTQNLNLQPGWSPLMNNNSTQSGSNDIIPGMGSPQNDSPQQPKDVNRHSSGSRSDKIPGGINTIVGAYGAYYGFKGNATHNELYWRAKNGNFYSTSKLSKPGGYARSYKVVNNALKSAKTWSNRMAVFGLVATGVNVAINQEIHPSDGVNAFMCGISFTGVGSIAAGIYFVADFGFDIFTGYSLNERIDVYIEGPGASW